MHLGLVTLNVSATLNIGAKLILDTLINLW